MTKKSAIELLRQEIDFAKGAPDLMRGLSVDSLEIVLKFLRALPEEPRRLGND